MSFPLIELNVWFELFLCQTVEVKPQGVCGAAPDSPCNYVQDPGKYMGLRLSWIGAVVLHCHWCEVVFGKTSLFSFLLPSGSTRLT